MTELTEGGGGWGLEDSTLTTYLRGLAVCDRADRGGRWVGAGGLWLEPDQQLLQCPVTWNNTVGSKKHLAKSSNMLLQKGVIMIINYCHM